MSESCTKSSCAGCSEANCASRKEVEPVKAVEFNQVKNVIAVVGGKGGVGKSSVTSMLAVMMARKGYNVGVLDADITGPSIPKIFGIKEPVISCPFGMQPPVTRDGIKIMSANFLLADESDPVIWRGPVVGSAVTQFWTEVFWGQLDYLFLDMPPGTGDIPLTIFQSFPVTAVTIVSSPQELVKLIVTKAYKMAEKMHVPVAGIVENMSYLECPTCHERINVFGDSKIEDIAKEFDLPVFAKLPINPEIAAKCDAGLIEDIPENEIMQAATELEKMFPPYSAEEKEKYASDYENGVMHERLRVRLQEVEDAKNAQ